MGNLWDETRDLEEAVAFAADRASLDEVLARALAALEPAVPFDLAVLYELDDNELASRAATGRLVNAHVRTHRLALERFPTIRRALETRRAIALKEHHHAGAEGDPYDGVLDLPAGHSCMVVPLAAGERSLGIITLDRTRCEPYSPQAVELADVFGRLVSTALMFGRQAEALDRLRRRLAHHNRQLREERGGANRACELLTACPSPATRELTAHAQQVARSDVPVLILGETGTGKEVVAEAIHAWSPRAERPFVKLNCAALPTELVESELFGHVRGAFSGARTERQGRFRTANGGTLLLDEIGDMPLAVQAKLLRVLQEGAFEPVGSDTTVRVDVRVLAATHRTLESSVAEGRFREDLYYRLATVPLRVPPLRDRPEDAAVIAEAYLKGRQRADSGPWNLSDPTRATLESYPWPGNVRQLINALERAIIFRPSGTIRPSDLSLPAHPTDRPEVFTPPSTLAPWAKMERAHLEAALAQTGGKIYGQDGAARLLELKPTTLISKLKKAGLR